MRKFIFFFIVTMLVLVACTRHKGDFVPDIPDSSIVISAPTSGAVIHNGDSLNIKALAISTAVMHGYDITIRKTTDTISLYYLHAHDHNDTLSIDKKWKVSVTTPVTLEAIITLFLDHDGHTRTGRVIFNVN